MSALFADYLVSNKLKSTFIDCDTKNSGTAKAFSHWLQGEGNTLDLREPADRDRLITSGGNAAWIWQFDVMLSSGP